MKKVLSLILVLVLCVGILAGCQQTPAETSKPAETTKPAETQKPQETTQATEPAPTEYTFPAGAQLDVYAGHAAAMDVTMLNDFIEEATGLDILWSSAPEDGGIDALLTEKVTPSVVWGFYGGGINEMGRYGAYVNLWDYQEYLPNFFAYFNSEEYAADKEHYMLSENELYAAPVYLNGDVQRYGWMYREDIFEELNLEVPTDWESFLGVCRKLKAAYPDSHPFVLEYMSNQNSAFVELAQQWGVKHTSTGHANTAMILDEATGTYYDAFTTDEYRYLLQCFKQLIDEGLFDVACLSYTQAEWQAAFTSGTAFITHDASFKLGMLEEAGKQANPDFSLGWFNNIPMVESDLPYACRDSSVQNYCWYVTSNCADLELALRYLDWLYSEEGSLILSWGVEGKSYGVNADGSKYFLEGYDYVYQSRYQESGYIDFASTLAKYSPKTQEMILGTMEAAYADGFTHDPVLTYSGADQTTINTYQQSYVDTRCAWVQNFLLGKKDINSDADWQAFKDELVKFGQAELIAAAENAYAALNG